MSREEEDTNTFFERLGGNPPTDGSAARPSVNALRDALRAQIETMRSAESATEAELTAEERVRMAALKQLLVDRGLFGAPGAGTPSRFVNRPGLFKRVRDALLGSGWQRPVVVAASLLLVTLAVIKLALPPPTEENIVRGGATPVIVASDPAATAESLAVQLRTTGAEVLTVQINAKEWSVRIDVPRSGNLSAAQKILTDAGVQVVGPPPYSVKVKSER